MLTCRYYNKQINSSYFSFLLSRDVQYESNEEIDSHVDNTYIEYCIRLKVRIRFDENARNN